MNKVAIIGVIALVGGYLSAQTQQRDLPTLKTRTWEGTLVASGCRSLQSEGNKTSGDSNTSPVYAAKASYGLITADGTCIPFDVGSNEKVSGMFKIKTDWSANAVKIMPTKVEVVGTEEGGKISVDDIQIR